MRLSCIALLSSFIGALASPAQFVERATSLSSWLAAEQPIALQGILNNIGVNGSKVYAASDGITIASPSKSNPDYFYSWTRDSALTFKALIDQFIAGNSGLETLIQRYITAQAYLQTVSNPSGALCSGGLGEPKFEADETEFTGSWCRPQRDGPALRATALMAYARYLISKGQTSTVTNIVWPIVQNDLSYVTQYWNQSTCDLWEEINSSSFFTTAVQYRALIEGQAIASQIGSSCSNCASQAPQVLCFLQSYWNGKYAIANTGGGRSGVDINTVLASIHIFNPSATCDSNTWQPCSDKALANHKVVTDSFRSVYSINSGIPEGQAIAVGRYPEDVYQGGNPWYLNTFAAAEQLYDAVYQWNKIGSISITSTSLPFFKDLYPSAAVGTYASSTTQFKTIVANVLTYADGYMSIGQKYTPSNGSLAEQFSKSNGTPLSAGDLTWSYASFITANAARNNIVPASWYSSEPTLTSTCSGTSATGTCAAATNTAFPCPNGQPSSLSITFNEEWVTNYGDTIYLSGSIPALGSWNTNNAIALNANSYTSSTPLWSVTLNGFTPGSSFQFKFFRKESDGTIQWESDPNRIYNVPYNCNGQATIDDLYR